MIKSGSTGYSTASRSDLKALHGYRIAETELLDDPTRLAAVKYHFITAIWRRSYRT